MSRDGMLDAGPPSVGARLLLRHVSTVAWIGQTEHKALSSSILQHFNHKTLRPEAFSPEAFSRPVVLFSSKLLCSHRNSEKSIRHMVKNRLRASTGSARCNLLL